ncbi:MAG: 2-hydroxyacyl-CoA dehydratase [Lentisphaerae bacterium]|nr:2-hydroxyacyl-CoA dehydratase [Lentisphaerota bacterium]
MKEPRRNESGVRRLSLAEWDARYDELKAAGMAEPAYGGRLSRRLACGETRLATLKFDDSPAALRLWNFVLTEYERLEEARAGGEIIVGAMKDLGTVPVMAFALKGVRAFYPDGVWWMPCLMQGGDGLMETADALGIDESFCPVRAMLGAFVTGSQFPRPDLLTCSVGAVCDDFSAVAQRLSGLGHAILWWEMPRRRRPGPGEAAVPLPGGIAAPRAQVDMVAAELERVRGAISGAAGRRLDDAALAVGIRRANEVRRLLGRLREAAFTAARAPLPALEMLIAEMLAIHFCSDLDETRAVLAALLKTVEERAEAGAGHLAPDAVRVFWVNPAADLRAMNMLEDRGGRVCGTDYLFTHALDAIPEEAPPIEALARSALSDPMAGPAEDRAARILADVRRFGAEALVVSRIPGASHCATEGAAIREVVGGEAGIPTVEIEVPSVADAAEKSIGGRLQALIETAREGKSAA